jgi:adenylate kinase family enzyme
MRSVDGVVLMGPVGCGKSTLGAALHERGIAHFEEMEPLLLARYGGREGFIARKAEALEYVSDYYLRELRENMLPVALQATGLSDAQLLSNIALLYRLRYARINTPRDICVARVLARSQGENFNNDPDYATSFHDYWHAAIAPGWNFDLELSGIDLEADVGRVVAALATQSGSQ